MSFLPALGWLGWLLAGSVPLGIVLLYFLKLRRQPVTVPSTYLWKRTIEDLHVNSLLQRLRNSLLLFLQLALVGLAILALLRPGWRATSAKGDRFILLLDNSASMMATDVSPSRFAEAKRQLRNRIENLRDDDQAMLIAFSDRADVFQSYTNSRARLLEALERVPVTERPSDISEALRAAAGLANPGRTSQASDAKDIQVAEAIPARLFIYSDGGFPPVVDFALGNLQPEFVRISGDRPKNLGILALAAQRNPERAEEIQALARIKNLGSQPMSGTVSLYNGEALVDASKVNLASDEEASLTFDLTASDATALRLILDEADDLTADNVAYTVFSPPRRVKVLLASVGNRPLEVALRTELASKLCQLETVTPDYLAKPEFEKRVLANEFDLIIFDRCLPEKTPLANAWWIGVVPPGGGWKLGSSKGQLFVADVDRVHPLMNYMELYDLRIAEGTSLEMPSGARSLITTDVGPLMGIAPRDGYQDLVLAMEIMTLTATGEVAYNTDWPIQRSWPVLALNVLTHLAGAQDVSAGESYPTGTIVTLRVGPQIPEVEVILPDGKRRQFSVGPGGTVNFADTARQGVYAVQANGQTVQSFSINLFSQRESDLRPVEGVDLGYDRVGVSQVAEAPLRRELWRWLLFGALGILIAEWVVYLRRVAV